MERAGFSVDPGYSVDGDVIPLEERPQEREILFSREPVIETLSDPGLDAQSRESMERWGEKTCLSLPLRFGDATLGVLVVCETERERRVHARGARAGARARQPGVGRGAQRAHVPRPRRARTTSSRRGRAASGC